MGIGSEDSRGRFFYRWTTQLRASEDDTVHAILGIYRTVKIAHISLQGGREFLSFLFDEVSVRVLDKFIMKSTRNPNFRWFIIASARKVPVRLLILSAFLTSSAACRQILGAY